MNIFDLVSICRKRQAMACAVILALTSFLANAQNDPPDQAGRISYASGTVSIQPAGSDDWGQLYPNLPIGPGDRIFTDQDGQVEIQIGQSYVRIGPNTDITLVNDAADGISFGVAQGSVRVHSFGLWQGQGLDVSTPNGDGRLERPGEFRADIMPDQGATVFTTPANDLLITGAGGFWKQIGSWQALELTGTNPVYPQWLQLTQPDSLDAWSQQRDQQINNAVSYEYVSQEVPGAAELDRNGDWTPDSEYGPIWFPRNVQADWQPYHNGRWVNRDPWGWVWVEDEPWGYAPFHYGRWVNYQGRWGWIPGPREQHPVWSPALVVFAGGGVGVSAWFPLGPGEPYRPWYPCSPRYIDRVNISNIRESRDVHVQTTYVNIVNVRNVTNITYVNRSIGVTAMRQVDFAAGRGARQAAVAVDRRQFDHVQVVDQPAPVTRQSFISRPVAHPVPVIAARPMFINHQGMQVTTKPGAAPQAPPVRPVDTVRTLPGRTVLATPSAGNRNQGQPPANNTYQQQPGRNPVAPGVQTTGRPMPPAINQQENNPNQQRGVTTVAPGVQPNGRPMPPAINQQENNPNQQPGRNPVAPGVQPTGRPMQPNGTQQQNYPNQQNQAKPEASPPPQPAPPATTNRQDFGPVQPTKRGNDKPQPNKAPANNPPPAKPNPPTPPANGAENAPKVKQEFGPQQGSKKDSTGKPNKGDKKDKENKDDQKKDN
jgi:hypothetical protein